MFATYWFSSTWDGLQFLYHQFWGVTLDGITSGSIYALVALGYTLVYGVLRLINFAHSEVFMAGTFGALFATRWLGIKVSDAPQASLAVVGILLFAALVAMVFSGGVAVALERIAYRPMRKRGAPRLAFLISAIGASFALSEGAANGVHLFGITLLKGRGRNYEQFPRVMERHTAFTFFGAQVRVDKIIVIVAALTMMIVLEQFVNRTRLGRGIRAVAQDAETATMMGVNIDRVIMLTFLLGGIMAGGAGVLFVFYIENTRYNIGFLIGVKAFTAAVLGGIGNLRGALLGGLGLGLIESWGSAVWGAKWKDPIAFSVLVLVLMARPTGLLGEKLGRARV